MTAYNESASEPDARRYLIEFLRNGKEEEIEADRSFLLYPLTTLHLLLNYCRGKQRMCCLPFIILQLSLYS